MRISRGIIPLCNAIFGAQATLAMVRNHGVSHLDHAVALVKATAIEDRLVNASRLNLSSPTSVPSSPSPFTQMLVNVIVNTRGLCIALREFDQRQVLWEYSLRWAECHTRGGSNRVIKIMYDAKVTLPSGEVQPRRGRSLSYHCPERTICQPVRVSPGEGPPDEIACVNGPEVTIQPVNLNEREPEEFCVLTLALPGSQYRARPGVTFVDLILTEQVLFPNGSAYRSPKLFIRDTTTKRVGVNRALRVDASINSAQVRLTSIGGKLQTKTFEFCMQRLPGMAGRSFTFVYSWFQISSNLRHGRIHVPQKARDIVSATEAQS